MGVYLPEAEAPVDLEIRSAVPDVALGARVAVAPGQRELRLAGVGTFVQARLPVRLSDGGSVRFAVWLKVPDFGATAGEVANAVKPWAAILGTPARMVDGALVGEPGSLLDRVLTQEWDRDEVLSRIWHPLPTSVRQRITPYWSLERTVGLAPESSPDYLRFTGPGRTVHLSTYPVRPGQTAAQAVAGLTEDAPQDRTGQLTEQADGVLRHAFWWPAYAEGLVLHNLHGFVAAGGELLHIGCVYDDPADLVWAQRVWRSARREG